MEGEGGVCGEVLGCNLKWQKWLEPVDTRLLEWASLDWPMDLAVPSVGPFDRLEWDQLDRVWGQIGSMLFILAIVVGTTYEFVRCAFEDRGDSPWAGVGILEFVDTTFGCVRADGAACKHHVAD